jgi:Fungal protein kinase
MPHCQIVARDTSHNPDNDYRKGKKILPDLSVYDKDVDISGKVMQYSELQTFLEFKPDELSDPFCDPPSSFSLENRLEFEFEASSDKWTNCRGQLASYVTEMTARQHRTRAFSIYLGDPCVRLMCWDRSAAVVTEKFNFRENSQPLIDILWSFDHASEVDRGRDLSVRKATREETKLTVQHLDRWKNARERPVIMFEIQDGELIREFIACGSMADPESPTGRATRAYPVYEKRIGKLYILKDSWRAATREWESDILRELNEEVQNVPKFVCGGDIAGHTTLSQRFSAEDILEEGGGEDVPYASGGLLDLRAIRSITPDMIPQAGQNSRTRGTGQGQIVEKPRKPWKCGSHKTGERIHHRFVEASIGQHLDKFTSSKQFMKIVLDAFIGKCFATHCSYHSRYHLFSSQRCVRKMQYSSSRRKRDECHDDRRWLRDPQRLGPRQAMFQGFYTRCTSARAYRESFVVPFLISPLKSLSR